MAHFLRGCLGLALAGGLGTASCAGQPAKTHDSPETDLKQADSDYGAGDFSCAEAGYRHLLAHSTRFDTPWIALQLGRCLQAQACYAEARSTFESLLMLPITSMEYRPRFRGPNIRAWAQIGIGECFEAEERWDEALEAYHESREHSPIQSDCLNGATEARRMELERIARCIRRLQEN